MSQDTFSGSGRSTGAACHLSLAPSSNQAGKAAAVRPDAGSLSVALELADQAIQGMVLDRLGYATLLALLYEGVASGMPYDMLLDFARSKAADLHKGGDTLPASSQCKDPGS